MISQLRLPTVVRPRCYVADVAEPVLLEDEVRAFIERRRRGAIEIVGGQGAGKSMALEYLVDVLADIPGIPRIDDAAPLDIELFRSAGLVIYSASTPLRTRPDLSLRLAPWGDDELIEYLLAAHPAECNQLLPRVLAASDRSTIAGVPELWALVLEQMHADSSIENVKAALEHVLEPHLRDEATRELVGSYAWTLQAQLLSVAGSQAARLATIDGTGFLRRALHWPQVQLLLAAKHLYRTLAGGAWESFLAKRFSIELMTELASQITSRLKVGRGPSESLVIARLRALADEGPARGCQSMAASLLHTCGEFWQPEPHSRPRLRGAYLAHIEWPDVNLVHADLQTADLSHANLRGANLDMVTLQKVRLESACLQGASLLSVSAEGADFSRADYSDANAMAGDFRHASFAEAKLTGAMLDVVDLSEANLSGADLRGASLARARLVGAKIDEADFTGTQLVGAELAGLPLYQACWQDVNFSHAHMRRVNLEGAEIPSANFTGANLFGAHFTGSRMPRAIFHSANLRDAGLADIHWERADLRDADLRGSTFHLGTTRSGLLFTPHASEGTRTGFYTDDFEEQYFKRPEEIRKANLRGADLRGAEIEDVDFYLVDLRDVVCTPDQLAHFRRCRAILSP